MMRSLAIRTSLAVCVLTAVTGCSQQYNGAWAFSNPADEKALLEAARREEAAAKAAQEKAAAEQKASENKKSEKSASAKSSKKDVPQPARTDAMAPLVDITKPAPAREPAKVIDISESGTPLTSAKSPATEAEPESKTVNRPWGLREFRVIDPDGNILNLGQPFE